MLYGNVLITGGAGFLGRGIMRKAQQENWPCKFFVASRDEMKHTRSAVKYQADYIVCDVLDSAKLSLLMRGMDYVVHTAAAKHIPVCEKYPSEAIRVNVAGTNSVVDAAYTAGVKRVVLISTDKACEPINAYGATKMLVERIVFESLDIDHPVTSLVGCRYGNIIGSTGSVWGVFKEQRDRNGHLSLTNPKMTRYFWGIDDAVDLIQAATEVPSGTVLIPTLRAVLMHDLAVHLTALWHLDPYSVIGERPGEKLHEMLIAPSEVHRVLSIDNNRWLLNGPTRTVVGEQGLTGAVFSELAESLSLDEFVQLAEDSESV